MKKVLFLLSIISLCIACSPAKKLSGDYVSNQKSVVSSENDGSSYEKAVVIEEKSETNGVSAEYVWIRKNYPWSTVKGQALVNYKNKPYDIITIVTADGIEKKIYFDISNFFGKL